MYYYCVVPCPENCFKLPYFSSIVGTWYTMQCLRDNINVLDSIMHTTKMRLTCRGDKLPLMALHFQGQKVSYPLLRLGVHERVQVITVCLISLWKEDT